MLNAKNIFTSILLTASSVMCFSQTETDEYYTTDKSKLKLSALDRVSGSICAGVGVGASLGKTMNPSTFSYIAPKINYQLTQRFRLNVGFMHYTNLGARSYGWGQEGGCIPMGNNFSGNLVSVGGEYLLNKKLIVSGAVMANASTINKRNNFKALSLGLDYKLNEHSSIGIRANVSQGNPDYMFNPARNSFDYNPMNTPTSNLFGGFGQWGTDAINGSFR